MSFFKKKKDPNANSPPAQAKPDFSSLNNANASSNSSNAALQSVTSSAGYGPPLQQGNPPTSQLRNPHLPGTVSSMTDTPFPPATSMPPIQQPPTLNRPLMNPNTNAPANPNGPSTTARPPGNSSGNSQVIYPWSQRPLNYLPISLAPPTPPEFADPQTAGRPQHIPLKDGPSPPPFPRYGHSVNSLANGSSGDLYIFGGLVNDRACNDLYVLQCAPNSNSSIQAARERGETKLPVAGSVNVGLVETKGEVPSPRLGHASVGVGNVLIIWGGDTNSDSDDSQEPNDDALYLLNLSASHPFPSGIQPLTL